MTAPLGLIAKARAAGGKAPLWWPAWKLNARAAGGGVSEPAVPLVASDFKNGIYAIAGESKTLGELWEQNLSWGAYSAASVIGGTGLRATATGGNASTKPVLTAAAKAALLSGFVAVVTYRLSQTSATATVQFELLDLAGFSNEWAMYVELGGSNVTAVYDYTDYADAAIAAGPAFKSAFYVGSGGLAISTNGAGTVTAAGTAAVSGADAVALQVIAQAGGGTATAIVENIEFYALSDYGAADLQALSA